MALSFLLRASLVIGALSYLALERGRQDPRAAVEAAAGAVSHAVSHAVTGAAGAALAQSVAALPPEASSRVAREALAGLVLRAGQAVPEVQDPPSRDTLLAADRAPPWRGTDAPR
jgi:hypothetical protein